METRTEVYLNGVSLSSVNPAIVVQGVKEPPPSWDIPATSRGWKEGQQPGKTEKKYRDIIITFGVLIHEDLSARANAIQSVRDWAADGGWLSISYRNRQRIYVRLMTMPEVSIISKWTGTYELTFRAWEVTEWEYRDADRIRISGASGSGNLKMKGRGGKLRAEITNSSGSTCNTVSITCGSESIAFSSLGLANGEKLILEYSEKDRQIIEIENSGGTRRSAMGARTAASSDDIRLSGGPNTISVSAGVSLAWNLYAYGRVSG